MRQACGQFLSDGAKDCFLPPMDPILDDLVSKADLWIHGHVHESYDYDIGNCRVVCNPRGYTDDERVQETGFKTDCVVEIPS